MGIFKEALPEIVEKVRQFIAEQAKAEGSEVSIHIWPDVQTYGIRVAEVSLTKGNGGCSWMQSDVDGGAACFFAERLALEYRNGSDDDDVDDATTALGCLLRAGIN